jgi:hypothetical protein
MRLLAICLMILAGRVFPQNFIYLTSIGQFNNASSFHISPTGFLFIADAGRNEIIKMDTMGKPIKSTGGYGWGETTFDNPTGIFATSLSVYIADKNNHRIQRFDKDLNPISTLYTRDNEDMNSRFGYPQSCLISPQGDLFILDTENKRILKFDLFGNFIQNFGGYEYGKYALNKPSGISGDMNNNIYVAEGKKILLYDAFGNGIGEIEESEEISSLNIIYNTMTLNSTRSIYFCDLSQKGSQPEKLNIDFNQTGDDIISTLYFNHKLYILTQKEILIYERN